MTLDVMSATRYHSLMIRSFRGKVGSRVFERTWCRELDSGVQRVAYRKLLILDAAMTLEDLRSPPGNRPEKLRGKRKGQLSIRINDQWRICFLWRAGNAYDVEVVDYH
jgi:proteic killer suppression protein